MEKEIQINVLHQKICILKKNMYCLSVAKYINQKVYDCDREEKNQIDVNTKS